MKKLYKKHSSVHPSPPLISDHLSLLPAAIFSLTLALSQQDKEVLAYLVSSTNKTNKHSSTTTSSDHPPVFHCSCFRCYMSYWVKWDSSPNRQLIHEIIDAFEDSLLSVRNKSNKNKKDRKKKVFSTTTTTNNNISCNEEEKTTTTELAELTRSPEVSPVKLNESESVEDCFEEVVEEEGSMRKFVSFIGERLWSVWT